MNNETKRKYDRLVNWALAVSLLVTVLACGVAVSYRAQNEALEAEVMRLLMSPPHSCPASIQHAFRGAI